MKYEPAKWEAKFLELYKQSGNVALSAYGCQITRGAVYARREKYKTFALLMDEAKHEAIEYLEAEAWKRAKKYSDTLMVFLLKSLKPEIYRENIKLTLEYDLKPDQINKIARLLAEAGVERPGDELEAYANEYHQAKLAHRDDSGAAGSSE